MKQIIYWLRLLKWHLTPDIAEHRACRGSGCTECGTGYIHNANGPKPQPPSETEKL